MGNCIHLILINNIQFESNVMESSDLACYKVVSTMMQVVKNDNFKICKEVY